MRRVRNLGWWLTNRHHKYATRPFTNRPLPATSLRYRLGSWLLKKTA